MDKLLLHQNTEKGLTRLINSGANAIGIEGKDGSGKKYLAMHVAAKVMKSNDVSNNPYVLVIDCDSKAGIEEVREAIKFLSLKIPGEGRYKRCLIFYSFEKLSHEGQNSLLKSFEEPPLDTLIIITTENKNFLLATTVSRLSWLNILSVSEAEATKYFNQHYDPQKIESAYIIAEGRVGMMQELLDNYDEHPLILSIKKAKMIIGMDRFERLSALDSFIKSDEADIGLYLWALAKVLRAAMHSQVKRTGTVSKNLLNNLRLVAAAQNAQKYNSNQKAILTELFYSL